MTSARPNALAIVLVSLLTMGCHDLDDFTRPGQDQGAREAAVPDLSPDTPIPDGGRPDQEPHQDQAPDQKLPDQATPDLAPPDTTAPDATAPDAAAPDAKVGPDLSAAHDLKVSLDQAVQDKKVDPCGNGKLDSKEPCDKGLLGGKTCLSQGFHSGTLTCTSTCTLDLSGCGKCDDKFKNGYETDMDCGGGACPKCADGKTCKATTDCLSGVCTGGVCACKANACGGCATLKPALGAPCGTCGVRVCNGKNATKCAEAPEMVALGTYCIDPFEASVWSNSGCKGTQYGVIKDDYPLGFPNNVASKGVAGVTPTAAAFACSIKGVVPGIEA